MKAIAFLVAILAAVCINHSESVLIIDKDVTSSYNQYAMENLLNGRCSKTTGCYKNYCWSYCGTADLSSGSWCYTTQAATNSGSYVPCQTDEECNACWNCGGRCGII